ncbi:MAG: hypothetical protein ACC657_07240 [Thiohalomonadales bacterium]
MNTKYNSTTAKWLVPLMAIIVSVTIHVLLIQINWDQEEEYLINPISVKIKSYEKKQKPEINLENEKSISKNTNTEKKAIKLIQDTIIFVRTKSTYDYLSDKKEQWRKSVTEININEQSKIFSEYTEKNGVVHIKIAEACVFIRESNPLWQFDEPIFVFEECRNRFE